jgi:alpha-D-ribose 1-methylphosphonate 5-triphosphate diphosphatase
MTGIITDLAERAADIDPTRVVITDVQAVTPDRVITDATIVCEGGRITELRSGGPRPAQAIQGDGLLCLPGLVDTHSDGLEKELRPRRTVILPYDFALLSFEGRLRAAGVTTAFHGVGFEDGRNDDRTIAGAFRFCDVITERRSDPGALADHRVLHRLEARSPAGLPAVQARLDDGAGLVDGSPAAPPLVSFEDHTPGQGQFRDVEKFKRAIDPELLPEGLSIDEYIEMRRVEAEAATAHREASFEALGQMARDGIITLLGHDLEDPDQVAHAHEQGASIAEFPLTLEAARAAIELGMAVVMGGPNVLRGGSHSGNVAARELIREGLCTGLASDYLPSTLLGAMGRLVADGESMVDAVGLITAGPADLSGLTDRGRLEVGQRADLILVDPRPAWPTVRSVFRAPERPLLAFDEN